MVLKEVESLIVDLFLEFISDIIELSFLRVELALHVSFHLFQLTVKCRSKAHRVNDVSHILVRSSEHVRDDLLSFVQVLIGRCVLLPAHVLQFK